METITQQDCPLITLLDQAISLSRDEDYLGKKKVSFWASETETMAFDIYHRFKETPPSNPMEEEKMMMLKMRKLTEEAIIFFLRKSGHLIERFTNNERVFFEWGPNKVPVSGYPDAGIMIENEEIIVEVKTYYGGKQHSEVRNGRVKTAYLKQLAIYMYHYKIMHGKLLMINQGTGERFEYDLYNVESNPYHFICPDNEIEINLEETFKRWEKIWVENVLPGVEPAIEYRYKYDIEKIKWDEISTDKIAKARSNRAVIGDWQVIYSDWKNLIVQKQKTCLGYSDAELRRIRELTNGYTSRRSGKVRFDPTIL